jgi:peptidoglycan/xylan/chitin deacetylase (PgdA/CDA1 family)
MRRAGLALVLGLLVVGVATCTPASATGPSTPAAPVALLLSAAAPTTDAPPVRIVPRSGTLALTFDDGPDPRWTPVLLDILDAYGVKATFFVLGWKVDAYPYLAREMVARGHSLQVHSYQHFNLTTLSDARVTRELQHTSDAIQRATGVVPTCFRPPGGYTNRRVRALAASLGFTQVLWSADSGDYSHQSTAALRAWAVRTPWHSGDVALGHEIWGSIWQYALGDVIQTIRSRNLSFDTICEDLTPGDLLFLPSLLPE